MGRVNITFNVGNKDLKEQARIAAELRGETLSEAMLKILKIGLPIYQKENKPKFALAEQSPSQDANIRQ